MGTGLRHKGEGMNPLVQSGDPSHAHGGASLFGFFLNPFGFRIFFNTGFGRKMGLIIRGRRASIGDDERPIQHSAHF